MGSGTLRIRRDTEDTIYSHLHSIRYTSDTWWGGRETHTMGGFSDKMGIANYMADYVYSTHGPFQGAGFYPAKPVLHVQADLSALPFVSDWDQDDGNRYRWDTDDGRCIPILPNESLWRYILFGWVHTDDSIELPFGNIPSTLSSDLSEQAFNYFSDVFPASLSFAEFVQGFAQLKDLLPEIGDSVTKTISGGYLNKKFGWDNLLSDLSTLGGLFGTVLARMKYLNDTFGIPTRLGFARQDVWPLPSGNIGTEVNLYPSYYPFGYTYTLLDWRVDFRATAWIMQQLEYIHDLVGFLRVLVGSLGLNNPLKAFWNTIPLSFVVDWFFNVSQHLDNLSRLDPAVGWDIQQMTTSFTRSWSTRIRLYAPNVSPPRNVVFDGVVKSKIYERGVGLSFPWTLLNPEDLSPSQLTLLLAMLHQLG